ncbi:MAG: hypothetical protein B7Z16_11360, partial [Algoriphagus sp. 32-45-6]
MNHRRKFIQLSAMTGLGIAALPFQYCTAPQKEETALKPTKSTLEKFGIQIYSVKEDIALDPMA